MLSEIQLQAADLVARDRLSLDRIARKVGVSLRTLNSWKAGVEFHSEVERLLSQWAEDIEKRGAADRRRRIFRKNDRWRRAQAFIEKRAALYRKLVSQPIPGPIVLDDGTEIPQSPTLGELLRAVPGGETGMVAWKLKTIHVGEKDYEKVIEYEYDTGLESCLEALEESIAIELGQWKPKQEISLSGVGGGPIQVDNLSALTDDELRTLISLARKLDDPEIRGGIAAPQPESDAKALLGPGPAPQGTLPEAP
jgi:hypothetical protein